MEKKHQKKIDTLVEDLVSLESYVLDLLTFSPLPICLVSTIGVVLEFNPAFEKISGYKFHEIVGEEIEKIFNKKEIENLIKEILGKEEVTAREAMLVAKDKHEVPVSIFGKARKDEEGKIVGLLIGIFDLSEIKETERKLQEKIQELEKFHRIAVGRELKMIELKEEIDNLKSQISNLKSRT